MSESAVKKSQDNTAGRIPALKPDQAQQPAGATAPSVELLNLQRMIGNQAVQRLLQSQTEELAVGPTGTVRRGFAHDFNLIPVYLGTPSPIQTKLTVNTPGDIYEQEADRVADQVMQMPASPSQRQMEPEEEEEPIQTKPLADPITPLVQRQGEPQKEGAAVQAEPIGGQTPQAAPGLAAQMGALRQGGGQPLPEATRAFFEPRFGHDFSHVRVHSGGAAEQSARDVNATAYTLGHNIVFGAARYAPGTHQGRRLIAHELAHVVQQQSRQKPQTTLLQIQRQIASPGERAEQIASDVEDLMLKRINEAIIKDPNYDKYKLAAIPLRLPVEISAPGHRQDGGVYYDPYLDKPALAETIGKGRQNCITYIKLGRTLVLKEQNPIKDRTTYHTDAWIQSGLWHEFVHYRRHLALRAPQLTTPEENILERQGTVSPTGEVEAYGVQLAKYFDVLSDFEVDMILTELAESFAHSSTDQLFKDQAIERICLDLTSTPAKRARLLRCIQRRKQRWKEAKNEKIVKAIEELENSVRTCRYTPSFPVPPQMGFQPTRPDPWY